MSRWQSGLNPEEEPGRAVVHYDQGSWKAGLTPPLLGAKEIMGPLEEADMFAETEVAQAGGQQRCCIFSLMPKSLFKQIWRVAAIKVAIIWLHVSTVTVALLVDILLRATI